MMDRLAEQKEEIIAAVEADREERYKGERTRTRSRPRFAWRSWSATSVARVGG